MKHVHTPETFADLLTLAVKANCLSWFRDSRTLSLILDDHATDRRTCVDARLDRLDAEVRTLSGYDAQKNKWGEYCQPSGRVVFPDKKGLKALQEWLAARATEKTGYPNPVSFSIHRREPAVAPATSFALDGTI